MSIKQIFFPVPAAFTAMLAALLLIASCDEEQRDILAQEERAKVSIARQNDFLRKLRDEIKEKQDTMKAAESVIVLCWDEKVVDLGNKAFCKVQAGGFFTPENQENGLVSGVYQLPANAVHDGSCCQDTRIAIPKDRFDAMAAHFEKGCQLVWDEHERQRKIAADKAAAEAEAWRRTRSPQPEQPTQQAPATTN